MSDTIIQPLVYKRSPGLYCSRCNDDGFALNQYGMCAVCWANLTDKQRKLITSEPVRIVSQSHYYPVPKLWQVIVGSAVASAAATWGVLWLAGK